VQARDTIHIKNPKRKQQEQVEMSQLHVMDDRFKQTKSQIVKMNLPTSELKAVLQVATSWPQGGVMSGVLCA
jgi:hypothetical protein